MKEQAVFAVPQSLIASKPQLAPNKMENAFRRVSVTSTLIISVKGVMKIMDVNVAFPNLSFASKVWFAMKKRENA